MATLKDLLDSGMSRDEINALLSQSYVGTDGFQQAGYEQGPPVAQEYPPSDMLPPPQYRGESMASQPMRQFIQQPVPQSGTMTQQDADDARAYAKHVMETGGVDAQGRPTSTYTSPQQFRSQKQLPQNYIQNERTGRVMDMGQSQPAGPAMDYSSPIEIGGYGKGYRLKGDGTRAVLADGRIVDLGRDTGAERARMKEDLAMDKVRADIEHTRAGLRPGLSAEEKAYQEARGKNRAEAEAAGMPGTKEYLAGQEEINRKNKLNSIIQENAETALESAKIAKPKIGYFSTGLPGQILSNVGGTDAKDLEEALRPIKALTGFDKLQELREMSKTGGALGQVAVEELRFLQSVKGSLDTAQSEQQFRQILSNVEKYYEGKRNIGTAARSPVSGAESQAMLMQEAQRAIAAGAPRDAVMQRLQEKMRGQ